MQEAEIRRLSTQDLIRRLITNITALVDREITLAKAEGRNEAIQIGTGATLAIIGALFLFSIMPAIVIVVIYAIAPGLALWAGFLIAAGVYLIIGGTLALIGYTMVNRRPLPRTRETLREDVRWAQSQTRSSAR
ncbi:MAG: phage holin family protein [Chloroflexota bacterium]